MEALLLFVMCLIFVVLVPKNFLRRYIVFSVSGSLLRHDELSATNVAGRSSRLLPSKPDIIVILSSRRRRRAIIHVGIRYYHLAYDNAMSPDRDVTRKDDVNDITTQFIILNKNNNDGKCCCQDHHNDDGSWEWQ